MNKDDKKLLRKRSRDAGERIIANGSLRDHMTDAQAEKMVDWSLDRIEEKAKETLELDLSERAADKAMDKAVDRMCAIIKEVDELVGTLPGCDKPVKAAAAYQKFAKLVVPRKAMTEDLQEVMHSFLNNVEKADGDEIFAHCWAVVEEHYEEEE